jgi:hypothetical protein
MRHLKHVLWGLVLIGLAGCGRDETGEPAETAATEAVAPVAQNPGPVEAPPVAADDAPLTVSDLDAYVRGIRKEIELRQAAAAKVREARERQDDEAEMSAMAQLAMGDVDTDAAAAAGLSVARWKHVKNRIAKIIGGSAMREQMRSDLANADLTATERAEQEANVAAILATMPDPYAGLDADVVEALKARQEELGRLHGESIAVLMNAAG